MQGWSTYALFPRIVAASGLSAIFAETSLRRAFKRAGVDTESRSRAELERALPEIEHVLSLYLAPEEARRRAGLIRSLLDAFDARREQRQG
jgi:hypothetical protein